MTEKPSRTEYTALSPLQTEDRIERSFQLAFFILRDRVRAIETVIRAFNKFATQRKRERKRTYWRYRNLTQWITKVSKTDSDILQWLIYSEATHDERQQEQLGNPTPEAMVIRYIKSLVQMTTAMSAFHLNVGLQRLLRNYSTAETQRLYAMVTDRKLPADEYRRAKGVLMAKLEARFGSSLKTVRCGHGELRFEPADDQSRWAGLVNACLTVFTPWSTRERCLITENFYLSSDMPRQLTGVAAGKTEYDIVETKRFHAFIDPVCFSRLTRALALDSPEERLSVPRFFMHNHDAQEPGQPGAGIGSTAPPLTEHERSTIDQALEAESRRQRNTSSPIIIVTLDGVERVRVENDEDCEQQFEVQETAEIIEVWTQDHAGKLFLASHRIRYHAGQGFVSFDAPIVVHRGRKVNLRISPRPGSDSELDSAQVTLTLKARMFAPSRLHWKASPGFRSAKFGFAGAFLVLIGWLLTAVHYHRERNFQQIFVERLQTELAREKLRVSLPDQAKDSASDTAAVYRLLPDNWVLRDSAGAGARTVKVRVPKTATIIDLQLLIENGRGTDYRAILRPFLEQREILSERLPQPRGTSAGLALTFAIPSSLLESQRVYAVELKYIPPGGQPEAAETFTFRTVGNTRSTP